eukprot:2976470-Amphidinium_carterae.1
MCSVLFLNTTRSDSTKAVPYCGRDCKVSWPARNCDGQGPSQRYTAKGRTIPRYRQPLVHMFRLTKCDIFHVTYWCLEMLARQNM